MFREAVQDPERRGAKVTAREFGGMHEQQPKGPGGWGPSCQGCWAVGQEEEWPVGQAPCPVARQTPGQPLGLRCDSGPEGSWGEEEASDRRQVRSRHWRGRGRPRAWAQPDRRAQTPGMVKRCLSRSKGSPGRTQSSTGQGTGMCETQGDPACLRKAPGSRLPSFQPGRTPLSFKAWLAPLLRAALAPRVLGSVT